MHYIVYPRNQKSYEFAETRQKLRFPYYRLDTHDLCPVCNYLPAFWYFKEIMKKSEKENFISDKTWQLVILNTHYFHCFFVLNFTSTFELRTNSVYKIIYE